MKHIVYFVSDHTGITVEGFGRSLLSQFKTVQFDYRTRPFIDNPTKVDQVLHEAEQDAAQGHSVILFSTIVNQGLREHLSVPDQNYHYFDLFSTFLPKIETALQVKASEEMGRSHGVVDTHKYMTRIDAIDFTLQHDDGLNYKHYEKADLILVGVSRSGKTPTCLYLAIQYGIRAANYPVTEEDLGHGFLPNALKPVRHKVFGLLIDPQRLHEIRSERLPNSRYASLAQCQHELSEVEKLFKDEKIPFLNTTALSIEEISARILAQTGLQKRLY